MINKIKMYFILKIIKLVQRNTIQRKKNHTVYFFATQSDASLMDPPDVDVRMQQNSWSSDIR